MKRATLAFGIQPKLFDVRKPEDIGPASDAAIAQQADALTVGTDSVFIASRPRVVVLATKHRLPAIYATREFVEAGGLLSYGAHYPDLNRRAASYIDKIFKGTKAGDLPIEQLTKLELVINIKTAKALGLDIPFHLHQRADEMIERMAQCPLLAYSGHSHMSRLMSLSDVKRTCPCALHMSAFDPKRT
jgi:putative ABC transport system substrate-binding protein